jgi:hypothetical protein
MTELDLQDKKDIPRFLNAHKLFGNGAEIGVFQGEFSAHILRNWQGKKLYLIDSWRHHENQIDVLNYTTEGQKENLIKTFRQIYPFRDKVALFRELSVEAAKIFPDNFFDFVFLDAQHDYDGVLADLYAWYSKVRLGGIFIGHDFMDGTWLLSPNDKRATMFGVKSAVETFARNLNLHYTVTSEKFYPTWYIKKETML